MVIGLLIWEGIAVIKPNYAALITNVVQLAWANQPWAIGLTVVIVAIIEAFLGGHFFAAPKSTYDELRKGGDREI